MSDPLDMLVDYEAMETSKRRCGGCTLCCKLLPVRSINKGAGKRCVHQRTGKGCAVYAKLPDVAPECAMWICRWLANDDAADLARPDRAHYVIDVMPDYCHTRDKGTGADAGVIAVIQIWCDPGYRNAHRDPALRRWLERKANPAVVRFSQTEGLFLVPPTAPGANGQWHEIETEPEQRETPHTAWEIAAVLAQRS